MVPIAGMIGSGLDMSRGYMAQAKLQNACDAAVLAGRREMSGTAWSNDAETEARRFFRFNFPDDTMNARSVSFSITQDGADGAQINGAASTEIPTTIMSLFGNETMTINVTCDAKQDYGNNDIMLVLDVTGSMGSAPSGSGGAAKIVRLRSSAMALYDALDGVANTRTRYGMMPYSVTVNVGADLRNEDILRETFYNQNELVCTRYRNNGTCRQYGYEMNRVGIDIDETNWWTGNFNSSMNAWRSHGAACIEERPTSGYDYDPVRMTTSISQDDVDRIAASNSDRALQWGRYDRAQEQSTSSGACPAAATRLSEYGSRSSFQQAINSATANVGGNTYHDIGMLWGARYLSSSGMFSSANPAEFNNVPVAKHIVYLTDGRLEPTSSGYTGFGVWNREQRITGGGTQASRHISHFLAACNRAKAMNMTIWVIALDVSDIDDIRPCATSNGHFFVSNGSDLDDVFRLIGQGIGELRLTQ